MFGGRLVFVRPVGVFLVLVQHQICQAPLKPRFRFAEKVNDLVFFGDVERGGLVFHLVNVPECHDIFPLGNDSPVFDFADDVGIGKHRFSGMKHEFQIGSRILFNGFQIKSSTAFFDDSAHGSNGGENHDKDDQNEKNPPVIGKKIGNLGHKTS